ncbi:2,3-bisphosphoglycerate-independent phosphoglycerate mutase [Mesoplasma lactucae]|uniref:2,3-bisphosphoglycerate-independent phosphoglycerate mutase n=1 Tax=Mesoplasma lactucae ATCC 49193 TaxID=81460 RepID=A0A291IRN9_9MOLU|nr:2,3-bisphosphoglycerate-independent phosphoglycerate mutase [Mesoplasma lactucae]ATG97595.1 phosphoglycerate mutase (2,3-diphosphoglycerate-independent) [Mesoplasma lactucae ATCC 49193]ATZ19945.1 phosphoglyceromutase [Mesoplasma lactucae ATCC 49193]MCL8217104.1 2,3-bisphosphoglycerate-independent phosphoglycerate mutase [Mesoplasma lactucae ATCC 49193]
MKVKQPILLAILDGWGIAPASEGNAVTDANMTFVKELEKEYPWVQAHASGKWVGLPDGQMGNSEVGHIHLGAGRINPESLMKLDNAAKDGSLGTNPEIVAAFKNAKDNNTSLHLMGLFSDGGVHAHMNHMIGIYKAAVKYGVKDIKFDLITDGRDTAPRCAEGYINTLLNVIKENGGVGQIASLSGRYYAMDRDKRWDRMAKAYDAIVDRKDSPSFTDPIAYINEQYAAGNDDEMLIPAYNKNVTPGLSKGDSIIFTNFRPDRAIQMASIMTNHSYAAWQDPSFKNQEFIGNDIYFVSMMKYADTVGSKHIAYPPHPLTETLGQVVSQAGYKQLRIAETEKIAHVTFFFDGGNDYFKNGLAKPNEITLPGASIDLIASPNVATYNLAPEMSAPKITDKLLEEINKNEFDLIVLNFANCDMVGHTGDLKATVEAVKCLDKQLERIYNDFVTKHNGIMVITADHGNAEVMLDSKGQPNKKHTSDLVPIIITDKNVELIPESEDPAIADVAPTILELMGIQKPKEMTQPSLIKEFLKPNPNSEK